MNPLEEHIQPYIIHQYESREKNGKLMEVAVYSLDQNDIKFRIIKFINGAFKEIQTTEKKEDALEIFVKIFK